MPKYEYQLGFSDKHSGQMYDYSIREWKANKMLAVLRDYLGDRLDTLLALDVGCSTGIMDNFISPNFKKLYGVDIDAPAVSYAHSNFNSDKLTFSVQDSMNLAFAENTFDIVICSQIYEHVPDSGRLMEEINRVLKPGGVCFFFAGNRIILIEEHYNLPLLSVVPKRLAHIYLRITGKGNYYYENHLTYWQLKRLVSSFEIIDYTGKVIDDPEKYYLTDKIMPGSFKQRIVLFMLKIAYFLCPSYIWLLRKK